MVIVAWLSGVIRRVPPSRRQAPGRDRGAHPYPHCNDRARRRRDRRDAERSSWCGAAPGAASSYYSSCPSRPHAVRRLISTWSTWPIVQGAVRPAGRAEGRDRPERASAGSRAVGSARGCGQVVSGPADRQLLVAVYQDQGLVGGLIVVAVLVVLLVTSLIRRAAPRRHSLFLVCYCAISSYTGARPRSRVAYIP